ncbi:hypothetical protein QRX95_23090 [Bacillus mycoides]|nr:hypothetical protein [Bacillus mycoides]WJE34148.1 hypothetical protein QRX95_23090 [Bacillus mycoides]
MNERVSCSYEKKRKEKKRKEKKRKEKKRKEWTVLDNSSSKKANV